jgi:hypothetical protein
MKFDKTKNEIVHHTSSFKDEHIIVAAEICKLKQNRLVLIVPTCKRYSFHILRAFELLGDDLLVYEITMGMGVVLESRAKKYIESHPNSKLYEKNPFFKY